MLAHDVNRVRRRALRAPHATFTFLYGTVDAEKADEFLLEICDKHEVFLHFSHVRVDNDVHRYLGHYACELER